MLAISKMGPRIPRIGAFICAVWVVVLTAVPPVFGDDVQSMIETGDKYRDGKGVTADPVEAITWYHKAFDAGSNEGAFKIGVMYHFGFGMAKDYAQAMKWYKKAADAGNTKAMNNLGLLYRDGLGVTKDSAEAINWFKKTADAGNPLGMLNIGTMYELGKGVAVNLSEAMTWYNKAAEKGDSEAMSRIGVMYDSGIGVSTDSAVAMEWFKRSAKAGNATAMRNVAILYMNGRGVATNYDDALTWLRKAAEAGSSSAMNDLGNIYDMGGCGVKEKDPAAALAWYRKGAQAGNTEAIVNVGMAYLYGHGVPKDTAEAIKWFQKAADAGSPKGMVELGTIYEKAARENGKLDPENAAKAKELFTRAAQAGYPNAMYKLSMIMYGGTPDDQAQALGWLRKAADSKHIEGMLALADYYALGIRGVAKNDAEAVRYFTAAATAGSSTAALKLYAIYRFSKIDNTDKFTRLGLEYHHEDYTFPTIPHDNREAFKWLQKAAEDEIGAMRFMQQMYEPPEFDSNHRYIDVMEIRSLRKSLGIQRDDAGFVRWLRKLAECAARGWEEQHDLACLYHTGKLDDVSVAGVKRDDAEAIKWLRAAASGSGPDADNVCAVAKFELFCAYSQGSLFDTPLQGIPKDLPEAIKWLRAVANSPDLESSEDGDVRIMFLNSNVVLAGLYHLGSLPDGTKIAGIEKSDDAAKKYVDNVVQMLAEVGKKNASAYCDIAAIYEEGKVIDRDHATAVKWMKKAADAGDPKAAQWLKDHP